MTNFTADQRAKLEAYLDSHVLPEGIGTKESACSIAAINLAIDGILTDKVPVCMSEVLGRAIIRLQDAISDEMRNSDRYKRLLLDMAGTGRRQERKRLLMLLDWIWSTVLPQIQHIADTRGFGEQWQRMCAEKTAEAAAEADAAARRAADYAADYAADAAAAVGRAADYAARAATAADAADAAAYAATRSAAAYAAYAAAYSDFWVAVDPIDILERMTYLREIQ